MTSLPRGLVAASAVSLAVHLAAVTVPWRGAQGSPPGSATAATLVARLIEAPSASPLSTSVTPLSTSEPARSEAEAAPAPDPVAPPAARDVSTVPEAPLSPPSPLPQPRPEPHSPAEPAPAPVGDRISPVPFEPTPPARNGVERSGAGLDRGPRPLGEIDPEFPAAAGTRGGTVTLRLVITDTGEVESIAVVHAVPPGLFDEAALAAFGKARFSPGLRGGMPVRSEVMYEVEFAPSGRGAESSGRTY